MRFLEIYLWGVVFWTVVFYAGGVRGRAKKPQLWAALFGLFWVVSAPLLIIEVIKAFRNGKK